jgi:hypothetical protein
MVSNPFHGTLNQIASLAALAAAFLACVCAQSAPVDVQVSDFEQKTIYHLPPDPANPGVLPYTAWAGLWKLPNGTVQCDFVQATGPTSSPVITNPVLQTSDAGRTWTRVVGDVPSGYSHGMAVLADGTLVRPAEVDVFGPSSGLPNILQRRDPIMGVQRSTDGGVTWSEPIQLVPASQYQRVVPTVIKPLSDGRLICMAGLVAKNVPADQWMANIVKTMFVSSDGGKTWGTPITLVPLSAAYCEESNFVELPTRDLLWIHRGENRGQIRVQSISRRSGDTFVSEPATSSPLPAGGFPCDLMTRDGAILDLGPLGSHWSGDMGQTWHDLTVNGNALCTTYYPEAVQAADGTIIVVGHVGSDNSYGTADQSIVMQSFRLNVVHAPEPSSVTLLGIGAGGLLFYTWRRRKRVT